VVRRSPTWAEGLSVARRTTAASAEVRRAAQRHRADVVYSNTSHVIDGPATARSLSLPHIWHVREIERVPTTVRRAIGRLLELSGRVLTISRTVARELYGRRLATVLGRSVSVVPDGIEVSRFTAGDPQRGAQSFVLPGRLTPWKGQDLAVDAFARLVRPGGSTLRIVGDATTAADRYWVEGVLEPMVGRTPGVTLHPAVPEPADLYRSVDALIQSSRHLEPFGRTVLEGMAAGAVVVAPDAGGPSEVIEHGRTGFRYPAGDAAAMARCMDVVLAQDRAVLASVRDEARRTVAGRFSSERCTRRVSSVIQDLG
jgi:glycosyltransferase involved in cell wall biosynthesis